MDQDKIKLMTLVHSEDMSETCETPIFDRVLELEECQIPEVKAIEYLEFVERMNDYFQLHGNGHT